MEKPKKQTTLWNNLPDTILPPFLSVILPCTESSVDLVRWNLLSYEVQTIDPKWFELILVEDGPPSSCIYDLAYTFFPFKVRYFNSPRIREAKLAHKNHARNSGIKWARGQVCFICDCDCLVHPEFVKRVFTLYKEADAKGHAFALYPMIASLRHNLEHCIDNKEDWKDFFKDFYKKVSCSCHSFGGYYKKERMDKPKLQTIKKHPEGFPILSKQLFSIIGNFDEDFLGWGGNKQEFQQRLVDSGVVNEYLLHGCAVFHQPHGKEAGNKNKVSNYDLMNTKRDKRKHNKQWTNRVNLLNDPPVSYENRILKEWTEHEIDLDHFCKNSVDLSFSRFVLKNELYDPDRPVLFVGPWVGEFGWEVCRWHGGVRKLFREKYCDYYVIVAGDAGHHPFYEYAHEYWTLPSFVYKLKLTRETTRLLPEKKAGKVQEALRKIFANELLRLHARVEFLEPKRFFPKDQIVTKLIPSQAAIDECDYLLKKNDIDEFVCIFPRKRSLNNQKNWSEENWLKLMNMIVNDFNYGIILMGREEDTALINENKKWFISTAQMQPERKLDVNIAFLNKAKISIGSESGGPFLSLLCGCPTLVMGGPDYQKRYEVEENYLKTDCCFLAKKNYCHPYLEVEKQVSKFLEKNKNLKPKKKIIPVKSSTTKVKDSIQIQAKNELKTHDVIIKDNAKISYEGHYNLMKEHFGL